MNGGKRAAVMTKVRAQQKSTASIATSRRRPALPNDLAQFVRASINTTTREALLTRRYVYDVCVAAAHRGYALQVFIPDVDREGVDVVLSDADEIIPIQLKATITSFRPSSKVTNVHGGVLKPNPYVAEGIGFEPTQGGTGQAGAVVICEVIGVDLSRVSLNIRYWVTNAFVLAALAHDLVPGAPLPARLCAQALINELQQGITHDRVVIPGSCFVPAVSAGALLVLSGLHSHDPYQKHYSWQTNLYESLKWHSPAENAALGAVPPMTPEMVRAKWNASHADMVRKAFQACVEWQRPAEETRCGQEKGTT